MNLEQIKALRVGDRVSIARRNGPSGTLQKIGMEQFNVIVTAVKHRANKSWPPHVSLSNAMVFSLVDGMNLVDPYSQDRKSNPRLFLVSVSHGLEIQKEHSKQLYEEQMWKKIQDAVWDKDLKKLGSVVRSFARERKNQGVKS